MKQKNIILKVLGALILGVGVTVAFLQYDTSFKQFIQRHIEHEFSILFECHFRGTVTDVDLFQGRIVIEQVMVTPLDGSCAWSWTSKRGMVYFSWLELLATGRFALRIKLYGYESHSDCNGTQVAMLPHLYKIFYPPEILLPLFLKQLEIQKGVMHFTDHERLLDCKMPFHCALQKIGDYTKATFYPTGGSVTHDGTVYIQNILGSLRYSSEHGSVLTSSLTLEAPQLPAEQRCFVLGSWNIDNGLFTIHNSDRSVLIDPISLDKNGDLSCVLQIPWSYVYQLCTHDYSANNSGTCRAHFRGTLKDLSSDIKGAIVGKDISYKGWSADKVVLSFSADKGLWNGFCDCALTPSIKMVGNWKYDDQEGGALSLINRTGVPVVFDDGAVISPQDVAIKAYLDTDGNGSVDAHCVVTNNLLDLCYTTSVRVTKRDNVLEAHGMIGDKKFSGSATLFPTLFPTAMHYESNDSTLASLACTDTERRCIKGFIDYSLLRSFMPDIVRSDVVGTGIFNVTAQVDGDVIEGDIELSNGTIKVPQLYNFMNGFSTHFSLRPNERKAIFSDIRCQFHRGTVSSSEATVWWDKAYRLSFAHVPFKIDHYFVSWRRDLFGIVSGGLLLSYDEPCGFMLEGTVFLDRCQVKGNLFSYDLQQNMLLSLGGDRKRDITLDVNMITKRPLSISTSLWDAEATFELDAKGSVLSPDVSGEVDIINGAIKFPYKPLTIVGGKLRIMPQQIGNPSIELTAKSKIKKYQVGMNVYGSLLDPSISFESNPVLSEEQIIALLLAGSHEGSLNILMPTLLMQNLQYILFGPAQTQQKLEAYFKGLLKPLSHVRFIPRLSDQTGRGGLRGALEIDVSDRLSSRIEKSFSQSEDWRFEVDYLLSDDVSIRSLRDERGDFGSEFEMRWKF